MAKAPAAWHADPAAPFAKADGPTDFKSWELTSDGRGLCLSTGSGPAIVLAKATLLKPPSRWNDDPKQSLTCCLQGDSLTKWLTALEEWVLPRIPGVGEVKSCVKTNQFYETFVRAKLGPETRFFDAAGAQKPEFVEAREVWVMLSLRPYCFAGTKGVSVKALGLQAA